MYFLGRLTIVCAASVAAFAQGPGSGGNGSSGPGGGNSGPGPGVRPPTISLKIPNETVPPGGVAQIKFLNTEPTPISTGRPHTQFDNATFDDVWGIELFDQTGDLNGVAMVNGSAISIAFVCNGSMQGTDYPVMTMALHVRPDATIGRQSQFGLDPTSTFTVNYVPAVVKPVAPATVTVGGSISITNVVPGGGLLPAGSVVKVEGIGFQPRTQVQLTNFQAQSISIVNHNEIDIVLAQATDMSGKKIQVVNPDGSQDIYYSYMRGVNLGSSNRPLLAQAVPIFSAVRHSQATFAPIAPVLQSQFTGLAMQNPNLTPVNVTVSLYSTFHVLLGSSTVTIPPGYRLMREISELTGQLPLPGTSVVVSSDQSIPVFGFVGDTAAQTVTPFAATVAQP